jgi:hypothetical protein
VTSRVTRLGSEEDPPRRSLLVRAGILLFWLAIPLITVGFLAVREVLRAREASRLLDGRLDDARTDLAEAREALGRLDALEQETARVVQDAAPLSKQLPCEMDLDGLLADVRARVEPLGAVVRSELGYIAKKDFYREAAIPVVLPPGSAGDGGLRAALEGSERRLSVLPFGEDPRARAIVAYQWRCAGEAGEAQPQPPVPGREAIDWPFDRQLVRQELELSRLHDEMRSVDAGRRALAALEQARRDAEMRAAVVRDLEAREAAAAPGVRATARGS